MDNNYLNFIDIIPYLASNKVYSVLKKLYENNHDITKTLNYKMLDSTILDTVDYDIIEYISRYGSFLGNSYKNTELSDQELQAFCKAYNKFKSIKAFPQEHSVVLMKTIQSIGAEQLSRIDFNDESNLNILIFLTLHKDSINDIKALKPSEKKNIFEIYKEKIKEDARRSIHSKCLNRRKALDAIGKRFFNYSYKNMYDLKEKYGADYMVYLNELQQKSKTQDLSLSEKNQLKTLLTFRNIYELLEIKDTDALVHVFDELDKDEEYQEIDFLALTTIDEEMKKIYSKDLISKAYSPVEEDKVQKIDGIEIYSPNRFNMFVSVIGGFNDYTIVEEGKSSREIWNSPDNNKQNHLLCTSYIGNENMCYVRNDFEVADHKNENELVIFGFGKNTNSYISMASHLDIGSDTTNMSSEESYYLPQFRTPENIMKYCRHGHNEVDFERRVENNNEKNIEPEYVVCFDRINEYSKKIAKDFGIPIVLINKREIAKLQNQKLKEKIKSFKSTKDPRLLEDIINIYQCARVSFLVGKEELSLADEFFNANEMNMALKDIMNLIEKERTLGNKSKANNCYLALFEALKNEMKLCKQDFKDIDTLSKYQTNLRELLYELKQIIKRNNIKADSKEHKENIQENRMYETIISERNRENVAR